MVEEAGAVVCPDEMTAQQRRKGAVELPGIDHDPIMLDALAMKLRRPLAYRQSNPYGPRRGVVYVDQ